ncbi:hypothetical protein KL918_002605 [Ogataea parapolymorpha]|uniref:Protein NRD1 n=1 Tax=Ogataea parapolymorpha (strain ATCC 26012 / BCRC 20466 / JCM 22074 / NRRL Y-7560 / DL-1) TaxID=871575 RepID=W1QH84_OGAPD|nr:Protein NRD1 [Ogataea parapolymorpha DL-1]ESX00960.1 Protein NRD1 [Ogataea parapolymorpha DL-1]KAG7867166.1 hypothetical protein KL918_002605 [Ogataea parapolymorpha]KAG7870866.1 hypothetical protein KL916_004597 [Ogataea parapolymorpha]KAG7884015.1 hypothetical protein KL938_002600 [Ogataea parapolymorpha]
MSVEEFETILKELPGLKAPGVSGSRIKKLKEIFLNNVSEESKLVSKLYSCCKATPATHKLGALYVVDAIVRGLIDQISKSDTTEITESSPEGTANSAVYKIQSLIENLVDDAVPVSNDDIKEKIGKLVEIWDKGDTFDKKIISSIKDKYFRTTTPPGTPPKKRVKFAVEPTVEPPAPSASSSSSKDPTSVLQALANLAKKTPSPASGSGSAKMVSPPPPPAAQPVSNGTAAAPAGSAPSSSDPNAIFQLLQSMNKISGAQPNYQQQQQYGLPPQPPVSANQNRQNYRERDSNPLGRRPRSRSPKRESKPVGDHERNIPGTPHYRERKPFIDPSIPQGYIKVYSRTIFIGGVPHSMDERTLTQQLRPYAEVQSVILNSERKHAFVKVYSRQEAESVIQAFSVSHHPSGLRARWGVGFGPRDCCDYQAGVSTIPISRLTDADKKWIVTAEWGGTGGMPLQSGLFIEEPDIEVGSGVSSKSISKKMPTNSTQNGPKSDGMPIVGASPPAGFQNSPPTGYPMMSNPGNIPINMGMPNGMPAGMPNMGMPNMAGMPNMGQPGVDQNAMLAQMMTAMQQMQQQGGQQADMGAMFQNLANMMRR